jgi:hypothetical protein
MTVYRITTIQRFVGLDADTKPTGVPFGSRFLEADDAAEFIYVGLYYAAGTLPVTSLPEDSDTIDIGCTAYTFTACAACDGEIAPGMNVAEAVANIVAAINGTDEINMPNPDVTAEASGTTITLTAIEPGAGGNMIGTVYTADCCSCSDNAFDEATLLGGYDAWQELP